jgi:EH signature protein
MKLVDALANLHLQTNSFVGDSHRRDARSECSSLLEAVEELRRRDTTINLRPPLDPAKVWTLWSENQFDIDFLDARQVRTLCVSATTAIKPQFVRACLGKISILRRTGCLLGLINAYFVEWGAIENQAVLEKLIREGLSAFERKNPVVDHFRHRADSLFSSIAPSQLASAAVEQRQPLRELLKQNYVVLTSKFARAALAMAIRSYVGYFLKLDRRGHQEQTIEAIDYAIRELLVDETPQDEFYAMTESFILCATAQSSDECQRKVREFAMADKRVGDPRLPRNAANWALVKEEARSRFLSWLARDSILFFFNYILPNSSENRRRKDFWLDYHEKVRDFQVALSDNDHQKLQAYAQRHQVPSYSRLNHATTSAFLMRFGDETSGHFIVEFSETGNAAYIFTARNFRTHIASIRRNSFELANELKHPSKSGRILHLGGWEYGARQQLAELGIRR